MEAAATPRRQHRHGRQRRFWLAFAAAAAAYAALAYLALPFAWTHYEHQRRLESFSFLTATAQGIPGDPLNVGLVGDEAEVVCALHAAGWSPADPITFVSSVKIIGSVVLDRPFADAPVSNLFYLGRKEDLAFEKPAGGSADRRDHVRLWKVLDSGDEGRPVWLGAATFDRGVGLSRYTGQVTHKIAPDIDAERDKLIADLDAARLVEATYAVTGIGPTLGGRNGGGYRYFTDGDIRFARLAPGCVRRAGPAVALADPPIADLKNAVWHGVAAALGK